MSRLLPVILLLLVPVQETSGQISVHLTLRSYHFDRSVDYNEWNFGAGLGYDTGPVDLEVGAYYNSRRNISFYVTAVKTYPENTTAGLSAAVGAVTGYQDVVDPMAVAGARLGTDPRLRMIFLPTSGGVVSTQVKAGI